MAVRISSQKDTRKTIERINRSVPRKPRSDDRDKSRKPKRAQKPTLDKLSAWTKAEAQAIVSFGKGDLSRRLRNEQRNVGRDITATKREISRSTPGSMEYIQLTRRLGTLQQLQRSMKASVEINGEKMANQNSVRVRAMLDYIEQYKGRQRLDQARTFSPTIGLSSGQRRFFENVTRFYGETPDVMSPQMEDLEQDLEMAVRMYDSEQARRIISKMHQVAGDTRMDTREYTNRFGASAR